MYQRNAVSIFEIWNHYIFLAQLPSTADAFHITALCTLLLFWKSVYPFVSMCKWRFSLQIIGLRIVQYNVHDSLWVSRKDL